MSGDFIAGSIPARFTVQAEIPPDGKEEMKPIKKIGVGIAAAVSMVMFAAMAAYATPTPLDQVATEVESARDDFLGFVTGTGIPVLFGLLVVGVGISLGVRYLRRGARAA